MTLTNARKSLPTALLVLVLGVALLGGCASSSAGVSSGASWPTWIDSSIVTELAAGTSTKVLVTVADPADKDAVIAAGGSEVTVVENYSNLPTLLLTVSSEAGLRKLVDTGKVTSIAADGVNSKASSS